MYMHKTIFKRIYILYVYFDFTIITQNSILTHSLPRVPISMYSISKIQLCCTPIWLYFIFLNKYDHLLRNN